MIRLDKAFRTTRVMRLLTGLDLLKFNDLLGEPVGLKISLIIY